MTKKAKTNLAASVRERLANLARAQKEDFQELLSRYARERLLYRLSISQHRDDFILKGALLFSYRTGARTDQLVTWTYWDTVRRTSD